MKQKTTKTTKLIPDNYFKLNGPCMVCKNRTAGFRNEIKFYGNDGKKYCSIVLDTCFDCSTLHEADMLRKLSRRK